MKHHNEIWLCPECKTIRTVRRWLTDPLPRCKNEQCSRKGKTMKKVNRDQSGGVR